ncbi:hypothetical protein C1X05_02460 [Laceyella sacchari]|nr:hypothetical protein C1X05_02460 [Laceyella sacchari]
MSVYVRDFQSITQHTRSKDVVLRAITADTEAELARLPFNELKGGETVELKGTFLLHAEEGQSFSLETAIYRSSENGQTKQELIRWIETFNNGSTDPVITSVPLHFVDQISEPHTEASYLVTATLHSDFIEQVDLILPLTFSGTVFSPFTPKPIPSSRAHKYRPRPRIHRQRRPN